MDQACNPVKVSIDGIEFQLLQAEDFSWLRKYGRVFQVMEQQSSGNLCFGVDGAYGKLFVKYAGAKTLHFPGSPIDAVYALQDAMPLYSVQHPSLVQLLTHGPVNHGYAAVFAWQDGVPMREQKGQSQKENLRKLPLWRLLSMLDGIYDVHALFAEKGYIAVDFYDGNLIVDFAQGKMTLCDVDLYRKKPAFNDRGRMFGSSRFMAPEEFELGAALTESTTVFNLGALAFEIFGDNMDRRRKNWQGPPALFEVASRATSDHPVDRHPSVRSFLADWREKVRLMNL